MEDIVGHAGSAVKRAGHSPAPRHPFPCSSPGVRRASGKNAIVSR